MLLKLQKMVVSSVFCTNDPKNQKNFKKGVDQFSDLSIMRLHQHGETRSIAANHELVESSKTEF